MGLVKCKDTKPELITRKLVYSMGYRYRLHGSKIPGKPDLVFAGRKKVIFIHGCFWHRHRGCPNCRLPKTRLDFWKPKLEENRKRDLANQRKLRKTGWEYLIIWECELKDTDLLSERIKAFMDQ